MIIFTIIGAFIGAGFASGQEIYLFFYRYGTKGILGIFICSILISLVIYKVLKILYTNNINSYEDFLNNIFNKKKVKKNKYFNYSFIMNKIINIFLCATFFIMISGFGAYLNQSLNINKLVGSSILAIICFFVFLKDIKEVAKINSIIVPILITFIIFIGIKNLEGFRFNLICQNIKIIQQYRIQWLLEAILYTSYNLILLIPVLVNLKILFKNQKQIATISIITGMIIFTMSLLIFLLLTKIDIKFSDIDMPVIYVIKHNYLKLQFIYGIIILSAIFTTAISVGTSFLNNICKNKKSFPQINAIMCITSVIISQFGFSNLVKFLYPMFGYLGLIQMYFIFIKNKC